MAEKSGDCKCRIDRAETTSDTLTGRGGLAPFVQYLLSSKIVDFCAGGFAGFRRNRKGITVHEMIKQILCFFMDGTNLSISHFDELRDDKGYASAIQTSQSDMASSHQVKRFFARMGVFVFPIFRRKVVGSGLQSGNKRGKVARACGVHPNSLSNWEAIFAKNAKRSLGYNFSQLVSILSHLLQNGNYSNMPDIKLLHIYIFVDQYSYQKLDPDSIRTIRTGLNSFQPAICGIRRQSNPSNPAAVRSTATGSYPPTNFPTGGLHSAPPK